MSLIFTNWRHFSIDVSLVLARRVAVRPRCIQPAGTLRLYLGTMWWWRLTSPMHLTEYTGTRCSVLCIAESQSIAGQLFWSLHSILTGGCSTGWSTLAAPVQQHHTSDVVIIASWIEPRLPRWHHLGWPGGNCCLWRGRDYEDRCRNRIIAECFQVWALVNVTLLQSFNRVEIEDVTVLRRLFFQVQHLTPTAWTEAQNVVRNSLKRADRLSETVNVHGAYYWNFWHLHLVPQRFVAWDVLH